MTRQTGISIRDVAALAGVSVGTVSNVLNRPELVSAATRERVQAAVTELGFVRNESARHLRAGRSRMIGLIVLDVANPFFTDLARGAEDVATSVGSSVVLCNSGEDPEREGGYLTLFEEQRVQGVLISPVGSVAERLARLRDRGIPVVLVDRLDPEDDGCSVAVDDVLGGRLATEHLLEYGHRRIGFVGGPFGIRQVSERHQGASEALGPHPDAELVVFEMSALNLACGRRAGEAIASMRPDRRPTAVFAANDLLALGVLQALIQQDLRVPADVAIVGYDDIDFAAAATVPLSSVRQPRHELGRTAAELLFEETKEGAEHEHRQVVFAPDLVVRTSSARTLS